MRIDVSPTLYHVSIAADLLEKVLATFDGQKTDYRITLPIKQFRQSEVGLYKGVGDWVVPYGMVFASSEGLAPIYAWSWFNQELAEVATHLFMQDKRRLWTTCFWKYYHADGSQGFLSSWREAPDAVVFAKWLKVLDGILAREREKRLALISELVTSSRREPHGLDF